MGENGCVGGNWYRCGMGGRVVGWGGEEEEWMSVWKLCDRRWGWRGK